jgi:hypothetical protein
MVKSSVQPVLQKAEKHAKVLRDRAKVAPGEPLDPRAAAEELGIQVTYPNGNGHAEEEREWLANADASVWSAVSQNLPDGDLLVVLNKNQTPERERVTIMEEVAHDHYGHDPTELGANGEREYDEETEKEAYWTAAAALLPKKVVAMAVYNEVPASQLAARYGTSRELVEMRIKLLKLWSHYKND